LLSFTKGKYSRSTLRRHFEGYLRNPPQVEELRQKREVYLKIDAVYFGRDNCSLVYKAGKKVIYWSYGKRENYLDYCRDFREIERLGYIILGATSDKHRSIIAAVKRVFSGIPHQYCLVHLQRSCQTLLTKRPETEAGKQLLELVECLNQITNQYKRDILLRWFERYEKRHGEFIKEKSYGVNEEGRKTWWYTHKNLRRAFRTIKNSLENMFLYLEHMGLEKDTNGLEAEFTHLKHKLRSHRGLRRWKRESFVSWYFYLKTR